MKPNIPAIIILMLASVLAGCISSRSVSYSDVERVKVSFASERAGRLFYETLSRLGPVDVEELAAGLVGALVGVRAEVVALGLEQVGRQAGRAVAVVVGRARAERRRGHAALGGERDDLAPVRLRLLDGLVEVRIEQQVREVGLRA
jgi:hypothetical protein